MRAIRAMGEDRVEAGFSKVNCHPNKLAVTVIGNLNCRPNLSP